MRHLTTLLLALATIVLFSVSLASAAPVCQAQTFAMDANGNQDVGIDLSAKRHRRVARRGGSCDGFTRCRCGTTAARHHGLPYQYGKCNLKMASEWGRCFASTTFRVGAVGVKPHHVLTVVGGDNCANATVYDDAGTYQRNVCGMRFVSPGSSRFASYSTGGYSPAIP